MTENQDPPSSSGLLREEKSSTDLGAAVKKPNLAENQVHSHFQPVFSSDDFPLRTLVHLGSRKVFPRTLSKFYNFSFKLEIV